MKSSSSLGQQAGGPDDALSAIVADNELIDNMYNDVDLPDIEFEKAMSIFRSYGRTPPAKPLNRTKITSVIAPHIRSISDEEEIQNIKLTDEGAWKAIMDCVRADHEMYTKCGCVHGDVTNRSVCWTVQNDGSISGVLLDLDDRIPEDFSYFDKENKTSSN